MHDTTYINAVKLTGTERRRADARAGGREKWGAAVQ